VQLAIFILICLVAFPSSWAIGSGQVHSFFTFQNQNLNGYRIGTLGNSPTGPGGNSYGSDLIGQAGGMVRQCSKFDDPGSVRELYTATGTHTRYDDDACGMLLVTSGPIQNFYRYTGEQWDPDLGMYYLRARYYQPDIGRFWTMDTFEGHQNDPLSLNKYLYAHGNPVNGTDPSGHFFDATSTLFSGAKQFTLQTVNAASVQVGRKVALDTIGATLAAHAILAVSVLPLGEVKTDNRDPDPELLYRSMTEEGGGPKLGDTARTLGVRLGIDIAPGPNGFVMPGTGGMSVAPITPLNLPVHRRPRMLGGTGKDPVWGIHTSLLGPKLIFRQDSSSHGLIEPAIPMSFSEYRNALAETRYGWIKVISGN
jgi:RHS repeat-associated protein